MNCPNCQQVFKYNQSLLAESFLFKCPSCKKILKYENNSIVVDDSSNEELIEKIGLLSFNTLTS